MSIFNTLSTAVSGMAAQSNKIGTIGDNIANSSTTGYKAASVEFQTLIGNQATTGYESGGVQSQVRYGVTDQGVISSTTSTTDLAINGNGFFVVQNQSGGTALTRAGSFVPDSTGDLVNTGGFKLLGYNLLDGSYNAASQSGTLEPVNISTAALSVTPTTTGILSVNVPSTATIVTGDAPASNAADSTFTQKTTMTAYDNLGTPINLDVYLTKTGTNTWQAAIFNSANASTASTTTSFPYSAGGGPLATQTLTFDPTTGGLTAGSATTIPLDLTGLNGKNVSIDISKMTQLASSYSVDTKSMNGNAPSKVQSVSIGLDGKVSAVYASGVTTAIFQIPLANVQSADKMTYLSSNVYEPNSDSGDMAIGTPETGSLGAIDSSSLESSTVDLASELSDLISTQAAYQANSKVLTTGSTMLTTLIQAIVA